MFNLTYAFIAKENKIVEVANEIVLERTNVAYSSKLQEEVIEINKEESKNIQLIEETSTESTINREVWELEIPVIELKAPINEGTTKEVMNEYIGHFENTSKWDGNIGLAAHNRGYPVNYFGRIKELKIGDEIIYRTTKGEKIYKVDFITVIEETNWEYLEKTEENKITLITCVENEPAYRRCIQGIQTNI